MCIVLYARLLYHCACSIVYLVVYILNRKQCIIKRIYSWQYYCSLGYFVRRKEFIKPLLVLRPVLSRIVEFLDCPQRRRHSPLKIANSSPKYVVSSLLACSCRFKVAQQGTETREICVYVRVLAACPRRIL